MNTPNDMKDNLDELMAILGPHGTISRDWDFMRDLVGPAWEDPLTDYVFHARIVNKKRKHLKPTPDNIEKLKQGKCVGPLEWLPRDILSKMVADALTANDADFFQRLAKAMQALKKIWPDGINEAMEPNDKWRWTAARFIRKHWIKHDRGPSQQALREHLESMEDYHGQTTPQGPLPKKTWSKERRREGSFQHVDREPGRPRKNPPGKSSGPV